MISHANLIANQALISKSFNHTKESTLLGWLPLYHDMGLIGNILQPLYVGATAYLMSPLTFLEKPIRWLRAISTYRVHTSGAPNFAYDLCARSITPEQRRGLDLSCWSVAFSGAEPVRASTLDRFSIAFADCGFRRETFMPCYGLAESTLVVTAPTRGAEPLLRRVDKAALEENRIAPARDATMAAVVVGCGHSWLGHEVRIVDPNANSVCPEGEVGEIWVSGPSVAKGYWGRDEETAKVFKAHIIGQPAAAYLRTGDLGFLENGELFITGRLKDLIIIGGRNYHPEDFERALDEHVDALRPGSSAAFAVTLGDREHFVVVVEIQRSEAQSVRTSGANALFRDIRECLAAECDTAPAEILLVQWGAIPKTSSGKIQRAACREKYLNNQFSIVARSEVNSIATTPTESAERSAGVETSMLREALSFLPRQQKATLLTRCLIANTARLLRISESDLDATMPIAASGIDSFRVLQLKHALDELIDVETPISYFFSDMTFEGLAEAAIDAQSKCSNSAFDRSSESLNSYGLSQSQQAMFAVHRLDNSGAAYNLQIALKIRGGFDERAIEKSIDHLLERHPSLRNVFVEGPSGVEQREAPLASLESRFLIIDAQSWRKVELQEALRTQSLRPFNLAVGPVFCVVLYRHLGESATLLLRAHHIAVDLWSFLVFLKEFESVYLAFRSRQSPVLSCATASYRDFVLWQRQYLESQDCKDDWEFWRTQLGGELPSIKFPFDRRPKIRGNIGASLRTRYRGQHGLGAQDFCAQARCDAFYASIRGLQYFALPLHKPTRHHRRLRLEWSPSTSLQGGRGQLRQSDRAANPNKTRTKFFRSSPRGAQLCDRCSQASKLPVRAYRRASQP